MAFIHCEDCKEFNRGKWHESMGGGEQMGGTCRLLPRILRMHNSMFAFVDGLYVQCSFGCPVGRPKNTKTSAEARTGRIVTPNW
jgi:hypothetical protein